MDIKELNKTQLILLSLLITFVVSIATGIVTVSLMNQMPEEFPQTINNVIQRTIEKVTTVQVPAPIQSDNNNKNLVFIGDGDILVNIYPFGDIIVDPNSGVLNNTNTTENSSSLENTTEIGVNKETPNAVGQGIIISDVGLILVESSILNIHEKFKVILNGTDFEVSILKKFENGFTVLKIIPKQETKDKKEAPITVTP